MKVKNFSTVIVNNKLVLNIRVPNIVSNNFGKSIPNTLSMVLMVLNGSKHGL
jgi:hypothetical protein